MRIVFGAIVVGMTMQCHAKCAGVEISVGGAALDGGVRPVSGATVVVSFIEAGRARSELTRSGSDGEYLVKFYWNPLSGESMSRDLCEGKLESATVKVVARGFDESEDTVKLTNGTGGKLVYLQKGKQ